MKTAHHITEFLAPKYGKGEAQAMMRILMEKICSLSFTDILMDRDDNIGDKERIMLDKAVERLIGGEPLQYIIGETDFCGLTVKVAPGVLIPRPETEELVKLVTHGIMQTMTQAHTRQPLSILDICTGSGCIALALKNRFPDSKVEGWDISDEALNIAMENSHRLDLGVEFKHMDILNCSIPTDKFSIIVSNPPYVCDSEKKNMEENVLMNEPHLALFVSDDDPLVFYRAITNAATSMLKDGGRVYFEINRRFGAEVREIAEEAGFHDVEITEDLFGNPRFVSGAWK